MSETAKPQVTPAEERKTKPKETPDRGVLGDWLE